jgi:hypothetical protein
MAEHEYVTSSKTGGGDLIGSGSDERSRLEEVKTLKLKGQVAIATK